MSLVAGTGKWNFVILQSGAKQISSLTDTFYTLVDGAYKKTLLYKSTKYITNFQMDSTMQFQNMEWFSKSKKSGAEIKYLSNQSKDLALHNLILWDFTHIFNGYAISSEAMTQFFWEIIFTLFQYEDCLSR